MEQSDKDKLFDALLPAGIIDMPKEAREIIEYDCWQMVERLVPVIERIAERMIQFADTAARVNELATLKKMSQETWDDEMDRLLSWRIDALEEQRRSFAHGNCSIGNPLVTREVVDNAAEELSRGDPRSQHQ